MKGISEQTIVQAFFRDMLIFKKQSNIDSLEISYRLILPFRLNSLALMHLRTPLGLGLRLRLALSHISDRNPNPNPRMGVEGGRGGVTKVH